ncbi:MAG: hypothetical protein IJ737_08110 [Ruminococcus sp.]|nr:hypothetical protein [Ruminococcus sp.]
MKRWILIDTLDESYVGGYDTIDQARIAADEHRREYPDSELALKRWREDLDEYEEYDAEDGINDEE